MVVVVRLVLVSGVVVVAGGTVGVACDIREALAVTVTGTGTALGLPLRTTRYWDGLRVIVFIAARPRLGDMHGKYKPYSSTDTVC